MWFWLLLCLAIVLSAIAVLRFGSLAARRRGLLLFTALTIVSIVTARMGRDLYGRPDVTTPRQLSIAIGISLAAVALERLLRRDWGTQLIVAMAAGVIGIVQGLTLLPAFWHGLVLVAIPVGTERLVIALALGGGVGCLMFAFAGSNRDLQAPDTLVR
jgi:hypothetical protein